MIIYDGWWCRLFPSTTQHDCLNQPSIVVTVWNVSILFTQMEDTRSSTNKREYLKSLVTNLDFISLLQIIKMTNFLREEC